MSEYYRVSAQIDLSAVRKNIEAIRASIRPECKLMVVLKADGYGHGSLMCAPTLIACGVKYFGVASIDEGIELRENKIQEPILVLGASPIWAFENAIKNNIEISILEIRVIVQFCLKFFSIISKISFLFFSFTLKAFII